MTKKRSTSKRISKKQRQARTVLLFCTFAVVCTALFVGIKLFSAAGGTAKSTEEDYDPSEFELDTSLDCILPETDDGGSSYFNETVFVGDSNTVRMNYYGLISLDQMLAKDGLHVDTVTTEPFVNFKGDSETYTITKALSIMKPRRLVVMIGTNDVSEDLTAEEFAEHYLKMLHSLENSYSYSDILVAAIPPVPQDHDKYPTVRMQVIDEFNQALAKMCDEQNYKFLNISEVLKDSSGYGKEEYFDTGDIHMKSEALSAVIGYVRTHVYDTEDHRPSTGEVPARASSPSTAIVSQTESSISFTASYDVENSSCGTLIGNGETGQTSLEFSITDKDASVTVTAVPADGYKFVRWSDGVTTAMRTDTDFTRNLSVRAQFDAVLSVSISPSDTVEMEEGDDEYLMASVIGGSEDDVVWTGGDEEKTGDTYSLRKLDEGEYTITATIEAEGEKATASVKVIVEAAPTPTPEDDDDDEDDDEEDDDDEDSSDDRNKDESDVTPTPTPEEEDDITPTPTPEEEDTAETESDSESDTDEEDASDGDSQDAESKEN